MSTTSQALSLTASQSHSASGVAVVTVSSQHAAASASKTMGSIPDNWQMAGTRKEDGNHSGYTSIYEKKPLKENIDQNKDEQDRKKSLDSGFSAEDTQREKFRIKAIAFLREIDANPTKKIGSGGSTGSTTEVVQPTNHMTIWYDYPAQKKDDLGMMLIKHSWLRFFKSNYSYGHDRLSGVSHITIDVESMPEHFAADFFAFLERETDLSEKASSYFRSLAGHKPASVLETNALKAIELAIQSKDYNEALNIARKTHAASIEENLKLGRVHAIYDNQGNLNDFYLDAAKIASHLHLRLLPISLKYAYKALEILRENSPYFKEAQEKMANMLLHNIGGDAAYQKEHPSLADVRKAREHLILSDKMSDPNTMELALQHGKYDEVVAIARRIHILSLEKCARHKSVYGNYSRDLSESKAVYDLYPRLLRVSRRHAFQILEILQKDPIYFKEAQEKMANLLLLDCSNPSGMSNKELKENAEKALTHLARSGVTSPTVTYLQLLARDIIASLGAREMTASFSEAASATANPPITFSFDTPSDSGTGSAATAADNSSKIKNSH